jgi:hypothetical protein
MIVGLYPKKNCSMDTMSSSASIEKEHIIWLKHLDFYKAQMSIMDKELLGFAKESSSKKVAPKVEQFQNRFIRQREVIDLLRHNVKQHENEIERMTRFALEYLRDRVTKDHMQLREEYKRFVELFIEMEQDFHDFLA